MFLRRPHALLVLALAPLPGQAAFNIELVDGGGLTSELWAQFTLAATTWEGYITDYAWDYATYSGYLSGWDGNLTIIASAISIDGVGGILGQAGPDGGYDLTSVGGYGFATSGIMQFDVDDLDYMLSTGTLSMVILHEMAHVIGFGTLWEMNGLYDATNAPGEYVGANAIAAYNAEFGYSAAYVPVELEGGTGTAGGHWDENYGGANPGSTDFGYALMSGWANPGSYITDTTLGQFEDLGYTVNYAYDPYAVVPEPDAPLAPLLVAGAAVALSRRRRRHASR